MPRTSLRAVTTALLLIGLSAARASAANAGVKDEAGFFSPDVTRQASADLQDLQSKYHHTVIVETFAVLPPELNGRVGNDPASQQQAFTGFVDTRAFSTGAGLYVMINKTPPYIEVWRSKDTAKSGLSVTGRQGMERDLIGHFKQKDFDGGLTNLTKSLQATYAAGPVAAGPAAPQANYPAGAPTNDAQSPMPAGHEVNPSGSPVDRGGGLFGKIGCIGLIIFFVVIFLIIRFIRNLLGGGRGGPPGGGYGGGPGYGGPGGGGYGPPAGGGGMGRGLFGGLLGGLAGSWLGNRTFGQGPQNPGGGLFGGGGSGGGGFGGADPSGGDTGGGSFGDSGSSDAGGGSFGDSGGGGGDSGGGGGDAGGGSF